MVSPRSDIFHQSQRSKCRPLIPGLRKEVTGERKRKEGTDRRSYGCRLHRLVYGQSDDLTAEIVSFANGEGRHSPKKAKVLWAEQHIFLKNLLATKVSTRK